MVKQEMVRANINILGISELNGQEWSNLIQMTITSTTVSKKKWSKPYSQLKTEIKHLGAVSETIG